MKAREDIADMLRAGATYGEIKAALGAHPKEIARTRKALGIPVPEGRGGVRRTAVRDQVAAMLREGATAQQISQVLSVSTRIVTEVRQDRAIPLPPGRGGGHQPDNALRDQIAALLHAGATYDQIRQQTGAGTTTIARVRKERAIPLPHGRPNRTHTPALTPEQALTHHSRPREDGHTDWTGPFQGRHTPVIWSGGRHNALHLAFRLHHGRDPVGRINRARTCTHPGCITGAHLTDHTIRQAHQRADQAFEQIFGTTS
jgi:uncharacterized protein YerC